jgi:PIN domain.
LELLSKLGLTPTQQKIIEMLLDDCIILDMNREIKKQTIAIKQIHKVKLPDAIIAATAISFDLPLLTSDKGYKKIPELNLSYKL